MIVENRVSVVMPYWQRPEWLVRGWESLTRGIYDDVNLEVVVVDDGSPPPLQAWAAMRDELYNQENRPERCRVKLKVVDLEQKQEPLNPCVPINRGVAAASGEFIVLTNPETTHPKPVFQGMREMIRHFGRDTYVLAAVFCPEATAWHCHSVHARAGYHFCTMLHRDLWDRVGGFDEEYRAGYCYDDPDFVQRLIRAGARFVFRDDLVVEHHQDGDAKHYRPRADWDRNRALFEKKWPAPLSHDGRPLTEATLQNWR